MKRKKGPTLVEQALAVVPGFDRVFKTLQQ